MSPESVDPVAPAFAHEIVAQAANGVEAVKAAWMHPGQDRAVHYKAKRDLFNAWPTLALAIERLVDEG